MKDDSASYFDSQEFSDILNIYENMLSDGSSVYFDSMDIANIAEYYSIKGLWDKSDEAIEYGLRLHPSDPDILISKANNLLRSGHKDEARVLTESITDTENQELLYLKGEIELAFDHINEADAYFTQAVQLSDDDPGMLNDIIVRYLDNRNYDLCQKWLDMALVLSPDSRNFIELQADLYFDTGQTETAIEWYNHLLDEFAYDTYYWEQLGRIYYEKNNYPKAKECFEFIEAIEPTFTSAHMMKAGCLFNMEQWDEAFTIYKSLLDEDKDSYTLLYYCGRCLYEQGYYNEALTYLTHSREMLMLDPDVPQELYTELYFIMASCYYRNGNTDNARTFLYEGLAIDPDDEDLRELAVRILPEDEASMFTDESTPRN
jgi:tetratricopeptide (TPR) repeat protein